MNVLFQRIIRPLLCLLVVPALALAQDVNTESAGARAQFIKGMNAFDMGQFDDARMHWNKAIEMDPDFAAPHLYRTWVATDAEDWAAHNGHAQALRESASPWVKNLIDQNQAGINSDVEKILKLSRALVAEYPTSARAYDYLAITYANQKMYDLERGTLKTAMALDPDYAPAYKRMSNSYIFNEPQDNEVAVKYAKKYVKLAGDSPDPYIQLGDAYRAQGNFEKASMAYGMAIDVDPSDDVAHSKKGHADTYLGDYETARADFAAAADVAATLGQKTAWHNYAAYTHLYAGDVEAAMQANQEIIEGLMTADEEDPNFPLRGAYGDRALIAMHHGMLDKAEAALEERMTYTDMVAAQVDQEGWTATLKAQDAILEGMVAVKEGNLDEAREAAERAKTLRADQSNPRKDEGYHRLMGLIDLADGNAESAVAHLKQANLQEPLVKFELAQAYEAAGDSEKAMKLYDEVANYNFNSIGTAISRPMAKQKVAM